MAPESNPQNAQTRVVSGQTVIVPRPEAGAEIAVTSSPSGVLELAFDPSQASYSRVDNSLVFEVDGGGKVTITDYFAVGDESLPDLKLPAADGEQEGAVVAIADVLDPNVIDLSTAAGPTGTPPSSGSDGSGDPLEMIGGMGRLGIQDTWFWGYASDPDEEAIGVHMPTGRIGFNISSGAGDWFTLGLYEDGLPNQHKTGDTSDDPSTLVAGRINCNPELGSGTELFEVTFRGFPEGTRVFLGDPAGPDSTEITSEPGQSYTFPHAEVNNIGAEGRGIWVIAPADSDNDFPLYVDVTLRSTISLQTDTLDTIKVDVIVDAVADKPTDVEFALEQDYQAAQIHDKDPGKADKSSDERSEIIVKAEATFGDVEDGSERHYIQLENIPSDWVLKNIPAGWTQLVQVLQPDGTFASMTLAEYTATYCKIGDNTYNTIRFDVTDAATANANDADLDGRVTGTVKGELEFDPRDWTSYGRTNEAGEVQDGGRWSNGQANDTSHGGLDITVKGIAVDEPKDGELRTDNNYSETEYVVNIAVEEDKPEFLVDGGKSGQGGFDNIIGNVGMGEALTGGSGHGSGEFNFHGEAGKDPSITRVLDQDLTDFIKQAVAASEGRDYNKGTPLGIQHADGSEGNTSATTNVQAGRDNIKFNLYSDHGNDTGHVVGKPTITWDTDPYAGSRYQNNGSKDFTELKDPIYVKMPDTLSAYQGEGDKNGGQDAYKDGYVKVQYEVETFKDADGNETHSVLIGFFYDNTGAKQVAFVGVLTPQYDPATGLMTGDVDLTFVQYSPLQHPGGNGLQNMQNYFTVKITDDDGDVSYGHVQVRILDDKADAGGDYSVTYSEALEITDSVGLIGNVLTKTYTVQTNVEDHRVEVNDPTAKDASSGSDGWASDGAATPQPGGVVGYTIDSGSYKVMDGTTDVSAGNLTVGKTYVIIDANGIAQGSFSLDARGNWSFSSDKSQNQDVIRNFDFKVTYTVQDADGDTDTANLTVNVQAAPILAGLEVDKTQVFESYKGSDGSVNDTAGQVTYTVSLYNYDGSSAEGAELYEDVYVRLQINGLDTGGKKDADLGDFDLNSISVGGGGVLHGVDLDTGTIIVKVPGGASPDADGKVTVTLPLADDRIGGSGGSDGSDGSDGPVEHYEVKITGVNNSPNFTNPDSHYLQPDNSRYEAPAFSAVETERATEIIDDGANVTWNESTGLWEVDGYQDNRLDGPGAYDHNADDHPLDGPAFQLQAPASTTLNEGSWANFTLGNTINPDTGLAYADGSHPQEDIVLTMSFSLENGASAADVTVARIYCDGVKYEYLNASREWVTFDGNMPTAAYNGGTTAQVRVTLDTTFNLNDLNSVGLKVTAVNDNREESGEGFKLAITGVAGNESTYYGESTATTTIEDNRQNKLTLSGNDTKWEGGDLLYTLTLNTDVKITAGTDTVSAIINFGGSATLDSPATFGSDYNVADFNKANYNKANPGKSLTFTDISGTDKPGGGTYPEGTVRVDIPSSAWSNQTKGGDHTVDFKVPTRPDSQIGEADEEVILTLVSASGAEIVSASGMGIGIIEDRGGLQLVADKPKGGNQAQHTDIYEDTAKAGDGKDSNQTVATYKVNWMKDDASGKGALGNLELAGDDARAASTFRFDISLKDGSAKFDSNMTDNTTDTNTGDYGWAVGGALFPYENLNDTDAREALKTAINDQLVKDGFAKYDATSGTYSGIYVTDISNGGKTLTFQVDKGTDLSNPLPIQVGAIDDRITENTENYNVILSNIKASDGVPGHENMVISKDRQVTTDILDDAEEGSRDGFLVGLKPSEAGESDGNIPVKIVLFERDASGNPTGVVFGNPPTQDIKVTMEAESDTATVNKDFYVNADGSFDVSVAGIPAKYLVNGQMTEATYDQYVEDMTNSEPPKPYWSYVEATDDVPAHWEVKNVGIPLNDDRLTEGNENFTVKLDSVSGHECSVLESNVGGIASSNQMTIIDDSLSAKNLDGPGLDYFGPGAQVIEPVATDKPGPTLTQGDVEVKLDDFTGQTGGKASLTVDGLVFTAVIGTSPNGTQDGFAQPANPSQGSTLVVDNGKLGVDGTSWNSTDAVGAQEGILISGESGAAVTDLKVFLTLDEPTGSVRYQIIGKNGEPVGDRREITFEGTTAKGDVKTISIPDLEEGQSVMIYANGAGSWYINGVTGTAVGVGDVEIVADSDIYNTVPYQVVMDQAVAQPTVAFIKINAENWDDFEPKWGNGTGGTLGVLGDGTNGTWTLDMLIAKYPEMAKYDLDANQGKYFVIIPKGEASASFGVHVKHDHDTVGDDAGIDRGPEVIDMTITNIQGSETTFDKANPGPEAHATDPIQDDMRGPVVSLEPQTVVSSKDGLTLSVKMGLPVSEDVVAKVQILDADGDPILYDGKPWVEITIKQGESTGSLKIVPFPDTDYIYTQIIGTTGGETQHNPAPDFIDLTGPGSGGGSRLSVDITAKDIYEGGDNIAKNPVSDEYEPESVTYDIAFGGLGSDSFNPSGGVGFVIKTMNNTTEDADLNSNHNVNVELSGELLTHLKANGVDNFTLSVAPDANGKPGDVTLTTDNGLTVTLALDDDGNLTWSDADGNTQPGGSVTGTLPTAVDDKWIEGPEQFSPIVTEGHGVIPAGDPNPVTIVDNDKPVVKVVYCDEEGNSLQVVLEGDPLPVDEDGRPLPYVDFKGNPHGVEGGEVYAKVVLVDGSGAPIALGNGAVTFNLGTGGTADAGDFALQRTSVVIENGQSSSEPVKVYLPDDFKSEDPESLIITATPDNSSTTVTNYPNDFIPGSSGATLTIDDHINGPKISFNGDRTDASENGERPEGVVNYWITLDKALEEPAELTFLLTFDLGSEPGTYVNTADGFTPDDIKSIEVPVFDDKGVRTGTATYTIKQIMDGEAPGFTVRSDGHLEITMKMGDGYSKEGFKVILNNDLVTEENETLNVQLIGTKGGELNLGPVDPDNPNGPHIVVTPDNGPSAAPVTVTDFKDGPVISLTKVDSVGTEGESINVGIGLSKATVSDTTIELKLGNSTLDYNVATDVVDGSKPIVVTGEIWSAAENKYVPWTGNGVLDGDKVIVNLPTGVQGPLNVNFPLMDNTISGGDNPAFVVGLDASGLGAGETTLAGSKSYSGTFDGETNSSQTFILKGAEAESVNAESDCTIKLTGAQHVAKVVFTLDDQVYEIRGDQFESGKYTLPDKVGSSLNGLDVTVVFKDGLSEADLASAKLNTSVGAELSGMQLTIGVNDDPESWDGPVFSVATATGTVNDSDGSVTFTITSTAKAGFALVEDENGVTLTFKLTGDYADKVTSVTINDETATANAQGEFTITLAKGANAGGTFEVVANLPAVDNVIGPDLPLGLELISAVGGESSLATGKTAEVTVVDTTSGELEITAPEVTTVAEGSAIGFNMNLTQAGAAVSGANISVTFALTGAGFTLAFLNAKAPGITWAEADGVITGTVAYTGGGAKNVVVPLPPADGVIDADTAASIAVTTVNVNGDPVTCDIPEAFTYTVTDAEFAQVQGLGFDQTDLEGMGLAHVTDTNNDFSGSESGMFILGNDTLAVDIAGSSHDDIIVAGSDGGAIFGGGGDDQIFAGLGSDILTGGEGQDTFIWSDGKLGGADVIKDFNVGEGDVIGFKDLFGEQGGLDSLLDASNRHNVTGDDGVLTLSYGADVENPSLKAEFLSESKLLLTLHDSSGMQTIEVNAAEGTAFYEGTASLNEAAAQEILQKIIMEYNS